MANWFYSEAATISGLEIR